MLTCYIIDDDPGALEIMQEYVASQTNLRLIGLFDNPFIAAKSIQENEKVDIVFMDIEMPGMDGLELAERIKEKFSKLVLTTGHIHYAADYIKIDADDFLLKPISISRFNKTIAKLFTYPEQQLTDMNAIWLTHIEKRDKHSQIRIDQIIALEAIDHKLVFYTVSETIVTSKSLSSMLWLIADRDFIQCHRSFIISKKFIKTIQGNLVVLEKGIRAPLSRSRRENIIRELVGTVAN